ncbi:MAG: site-specific integrase [Clostridia bacterium]|nr:site-specific integrase [Clostridia bacterium]
MSKNVTGHLREKKGHYYAVVSYYAENGERKQKWVLTKLPIRGNKKKAENILRQILDDFKASEDAGESEVIDVNASGTANVTRAKKVIRYDILKNMNLDDIPKEQVQNLLFSDYLKKYVPLTRKRTKKIEDTTYSSYLGNVTNPIAPYFEEQGITLGELTARDIQTFYDIQLERVTANTVIHYHAIIRLSLCYARKMGYIKENPIEEVDKPERNQYVGKFYSGEELNRVICLTKDTKLELPVIFGGFYGLRRSEIVGLRWSAIDFENNVFYINHTVTTPVIDGSKKIVAKDRAKTKSSLRALPLDEDLKKRLLEIRARQEIYRKKFKSSYNKEWLEYVMVDELGDLIMPDYITSSWKNLLEKNGLRVIRFHDLRHTCASLLLNKGKENGITLKDIQMWLGHSDFSTTANTYSHLEATSKFSSLDTLAGIVHLNNQ